MTALHAQTWPAILLLAALSLTLLACASEDYYSATPTPPLPTVTATPVPTPTPHAAPATAVPIPTPTPHAAPAVIPASSTPDPGEWFNDRASQAIDVVCQVAEWYESRRQPSNADYAAEWRTAKLEATDACKILTAYLPLEPDDDARVNEFKRVIANVEGEAAWWTSYSYQRGLSQLLEYADDLVDFLYIVNTWPARCKDNADVVADWLTEWYVNGTVDGERGFVGNVLKKDGRGGYGTRPNFGFQFLVASSVADDIGGYFHTYTWHRPLDPPEPVTSETVGALLSEWLQQEYEACDLHSPFAGRGQ